MSSPPLSDIEAQVQTATGLIVAWGQFPDGLSPDATGLELRPVLESEVPKLSQPGTKTMAADGTITVTPPPPPPVQYAGVYPVDAITRTTDATPLEVFRFPCDPKHVYRASLVITGVDAGSGAVKVMDGRFVWKRWAAGAIMTGITVVSDLHDAAAASWAPNALASGNDVVFTVMGAAGRTIDWMLTGDVSQYAPEGLTS